MPDFTVDLSEWNPQGDGSVHGNDKNPVPSSTLITTTNTSVLPCHIDISAVSASVFQDISQQAHSPETPANVHATFEFIPGGGIPGFFNGDAYRATLPQGLRYTANTISFEAPNIIRDSANGFGDIPVGVRIAVTGSGLNNDDQFYANVVAPGQIETIGTVVVTEPVGNNVTIGLDVQGRAGLAGIGLIGALDGTLTDDLYVTAVVRFNDGIRLENGSYKNIGVKLFGTYSNPDPFLGPCRAFLYMDEASGTGQMGFINAEGANKYPSNDLSNYSIMRLDGSGGPNDFLNDYVILQHRVDLSGIPRHSLYTYNSSGQVIDDDLGYDNYPQGGGCAIKTDHELINTFGDVWESAILGTLNASMDVAFYGISTTPELPPGLPLP